MTEHTDILIIGGGISGLLTAREFRLAGLDVTVVDQSALGQESSWAGGGILLPIYPWRQDAAISELVIASLAIYPNLSQELFEATGIDPEWLPCGMLICKNPDIDVATQWCQTYSIRYQQADDSMFAELNCTFEHPLWLPDIAQARNPRLLKSLVAFLKQIGVSFIEQTHINHLEIEQQRIRNIQIDNRTFTANQVVLCAGAWSSKFLQRWFPDCGLQLDIQPVRGQMLLFDAQPETLKHMILDGDHYLIPRKDGKILAGSTVEEVGFEKMTTEAVRQQLHNFATELFPELKRHPVCNHWAGLRPGTPRGVPYIGTHPEIANLSINAGHFRNGLVMGPASARLLADLILARPPIVDPSPYTPGRTLS
jgi:glycine oxidase